ncbi:MAG: IclR family transcriptional regulator [Pseudomonadota bacterium]
MSVAAVDRTLLVIEALAGAPRPMELSVIARNVGLPASATHRILTTLCERGWAMQDAASDGYLLSLRIAVLAFRRLESRMMRDVVQVALDRLALRTKEYCRLAVVDGDDLVWVARAQGAPAGLRYEPGMGEEIVLHATANGKAWLASMEDARAKAILAGRGLDATAGVGPRAMSEMANVLREIRRVRKVGYGTAYEEAEAATSAVAVAFRAGPEADAPVAGTVSVAGPHTRITKARFDEFAAVLGETAKELAELWPIRAFDDAADGPVRLRA